MSFAFDVLHSLIGQEGTYFRLADTLGLRDVSNGGRLKLVFDTSTREIKQVVPDPVNKKSCVSETSLRFRLCGGRVGVPLSDLQAAGLYDIVNDVHPYISNGMSIVYLNPLCVESSSHAKTPTTNKKCVHGKVMSDPTYSFCSVGCKLNLSVQTAEVNGQRKVQKKTKREDGLDEAYMRSVKKMRERMTVNTKDASQDVQIIQSLANTCTFT